MKEAEKLFKEGINLIEKNNFSGAEEILRKSLGLMMGYDSYESNILKFQINIKLGEALYKSGRGGEGIIPYSDALLIARDLRHKEYETLARISLARSYFLTSQYDLCLKEAYQGLKISKENNYYEFCSLSAYFCGMANRNLRQLQNALDFFEEALYYGRKSGSGTKIANALNEKGNILFLMGNFSEALKIKLEALEFAKKEGDKESISNFLNDISIIYSQRGNHQQAENYLIESLKITENLGNERNILYCLLNLAL
ncbi:MAG: tetratricopeptide repeat protein, partial [Thermoanaerobaculia bacterium]